MKNDCAGWWRRFAAASIDFVVVLTIVQTVVGAGAQRIIEVNQLRHRIKLHQRIR